MVLYEGMSGSKIHAALDDGVGIVVLAECLISLYLIFGPNGGRDEGGKNGLLYTMV
jgi:hypothetical protein